MSVKLATKMMDTLPPTIRKRAGKSYLQMKTSLRKSRAMKTWTMMAVAELQDKSTMLANGVAAEHAM